MISGPLVKDTQYWLEHFRAILTSGVPMRLHHRDLDLDGNPDWHPEFAHWIAGTAGRREGSEDHARLSRAMKRLRERSLREYEVLRRVLVMGHSLAETAEWLNLRAIRGGHPERYTPSDALVIVYAAVDKVRDWY